MFHGIMQPIAHFHNKRKPSVVRRPIGSLVGQRCEFFKDFYMTEILISHMETDLDPDPLDLRRFESLNRVTVRAQLMQWAKAWGELLPIALFTVCRIEGLDLFLCELQA